MKTIFDAVEKVYRTLNVSEVKSQITGGIYLHNSRPADSIKEDISINSLGIGSEVLQKAIVNVNIHIPAKKIVVSGINQYTADAARFKAISNIVLPLLKDTWIDDCHFEVQQQNLMQDLKENQFISNIRLEFYFENL